MSGKPYPEGVERVAVLLRKEHQLRVELGALKPHVERYHKAQEEYGKISTEVAKLLESMDLEGQGNYGFGGRMGWFLRTMRELILKDLAKPQEGP